MSTAAVVTAAPKVSWLKRIGQVIGKIFTVTTKDIAPVADKLTPVIETLFPQFAPGIAFADNLIDNIAKEAITAEAMEVAGAAAQGGPAKLAAVLSASGPAIDGWIASRFPGSTGLAAAQKVNIVQAVVDAVNSLTPPPVGAPVVTPPVVATK